MSLMQGLRLYPKAIAWSILISTCICMEGYDVCLLSNFCAFFASFSPKSHLTSSIQPDAFPQFNAKYGKQLPDGTFQVPAPWQAGLSNGANVGEILGLFLNGWVSERFGYRYTVMACLICLIGFQTIFFTAQNVVDLQIAEILCGVPWGVFQTRTWLSLLRCFLLAISRAACL
jgi:SP family general alpha glucoside:H+ symporter-like MFS transporter